MMNFAQAAIAAQKGGQNIAGATLGNMIGGNLAQMPGFGGSANGSQAATTPGALGEAKPAASALSGNETQGEGGLESRIAALEQGTESNDLGNFKPQDVLAAGTRFGQQQVPGTFDRSLNAQNLT